MKLNNKKVKSLVKILNIILITLLILFALLYLNILSLVKLFLFRDNLNPEYIQECIEVIRDIALKQKNRKIDRFVVSLLDLVFSEEEDVAPIYLHQLSLLWKV